MVDGNSQARITKVARAKIATMLRKHAQMLTFVAAFIVFATFMIREEVREDLKDLVASIESAQTVFATRRDTASIVEQLNTIGIMASDMAFEVMKGKTPEERRSKTILASRFRVFAIKDYARSQQALLDNVFGLLEKVGDDANQRRHITQLQAQVVDLQKSCDEAADHLDPFDPFRAGMKNKRRDDNDYAAWVMPLISRSWNLYPSVQSSADDVFKLASEARHRRERQYRLVNWFSIGLFTMGWGLGLLAKICGIEPSAGEE